MIILHRNARWILAWAVLVLVPMTARAQYWGEQVLEKSFERSDFFFRPSHLNPYALGSFESSALGLLSDPLLNLQINPAYVSTDSLPDQYAYLDFRSTREIVDRGIVPYVADYIGGARLDYIAYPYYYSRVRTETSPVFSGAYVARPGGVFRRLTLGATYQLVLQDQRYYSIPHDIYRNDPRLSFAADESGGANQIPIVDRYSGSDGLQERGHFGALHAGLRIFDGLDAGLRIGRTTFSREGEFGSNNLWPSSLQRESFWRHSEERDQSYDHWDVSGGLNLRLRPGVLVGATGGYLWGDVTQDLMQQDTSFSEYANSFDEYRSTYLHSGFKDQNWFHDGRSYHGGLNLLTRLSPRTNLHAYYRRRVETADIELSSALADTSFGSSHYEYDTQVYDYESHSAVRDVRIGTGEEEQITHRAAVNFQWQIDPATSVRLGGNLMSRRRTVATEEDVAARRHSYYYSSGSGGTYEQESRTVEEKVLQWDFESRSYAVQVPLFITRRLSDAVDLLFGGSWDGRSRT